MLSYSKFKKLTNSIEDNCFNNKKFMIMYTIISRAFTNLKDIVTKHWRILQANQSCEKTFSTLPIIAFRKGISLKQINVTNTVRSNKKLIKTKNNYHTGKCVPCKSTRCLCYQERISTTAFKINQTNKTMKSSFVIYLIECFICNIRYVGKSEAPFNITLDNHRKDIENLKAIPSCKHFNRHHHDFSNREEIIIIEQLRKIQNTSTKTLKKD